MVRGSYCQQVITFFLFDIQLTARLKSGSAPATSGIRNKFVNNINVILKET